MKLQLKIQNGSLPTVYPRCSRGEAWAFQEGERRAQVV